MSNSSHQLIALCAALNLLDYGLEYFIDSPPASEDTPPLNADGRRALNPYHEFLKTQEIYTRKRTAAVPMVTMKICTNKASAGLGDFLNDDYFEEEEFPAAEVPYGSDFGVYVNGDSMEPRYHNGQIAWIKKSQILNDGEKTP